MSAHVCRVERSLFGFRSTHLRVLDDNRLVMPFKAFDELGAIDVILAYSSAVIVKFPYVEKFVHIVQCRPGPFGAELCNKMSNCKPFKEVRQSSIAQFD